MSNMPTSSNAPTHLKLKYLDVTINLLLTTEAASGTANSAPLFCPAKDCHFTVASLLQEEDLQKHFKESHSTDVSLMLCLKPKGVARLPYKSFTLQFDPKQKLAEASKELAPRAETGPTAVAASTNMVPATPQQVPNERQHEAGKTQPDAVQAIQFDPKAMLAEASKELAPRAETGPTAVAASTNMVPAIPQQVPREPQHEADKTEPDSVQTIQVDPKPILAEASKELAPSAETGPSTADAAASTNTVVPAIPQPEQVPREPQHEEEKTEPDAVETLKKETKKKIIMVLEEAFRFVLDDFEIEAIERKIDAIKNLHMKCLEAFSEIEAPDEPEAVVKTEPTNNTASLPTAAQPVARKRKREQDDAEPDAVEEVKKMTKRKIMKEMEGTFGVDMDTDEIVDTEKNIDGFKRLHDKCVEVLREVE